MLKAIFIAVLRVRFHLILIYLLYYFCCNNNISIVLENLPSHKPILNSEHAFHYIPFAYGCAGACLPSE